MSIFPGISRIFWIRSVYEMNERELCRKRLIDLSRQADWTGIVTFSAFLNLEEQNIYHNTMDEFYTKTASFGGYDGSERQMAAFIPDALSYDWKYPVACLKISPLYPKYAQELTHRDVLGALMHLGLDRGKYGDILRQESYFLLFCEESVASFLMGELTRISRTEVKAEVFETDAELRFAPELEERPEIVASNRIDCIIAKAYHLSRAQAAEYLKSEKVFLNGRTVTDCNQSCESGTVVSVRGKGRFRFETDGASSKKGKLRVRFLMYR